MKTLRKDFDQLRKEYETLLEIHRETAEERDNFCAELQRVQRNCTPRPNWAKCSGAKRIQEWFAEGSSPLNTLLWRISYLQRPIFYQAFRSGLRGACRVFHFALDILGDKLEV